MIIVRGRMNQNPIQTLEKAVLRQKDMYWLNPLVVPDTYSVLCFSIDCNVDRHQLFSNTAEVENLLNPDM